MIQDSPRLGDSQESKCFGAVSAPWGASSARARTAWRQTRRASSGRDRDSPMPAKPDRLRPRRLGRCLPTSPDSEAPDRRRSELPVRAPIFCLASEVLQPTKRGSRLILEPWSFAPPASATRHYDKRKAAPDVASRLRQKIEENEAPGRLALLGAVENLDTHAHLLAKLSHQ